MPAPVFTFGASVATPGPDTPGPATSPISPPIVTRANSPRTVERRMPFIPTSFGPNVRHNVGKHRSQPQHDGIVRSAESGQDRASAGDANRQPGGTAQGHG